MVVDLSGDIEIEARLIDLGVTPGLEFQIQKKLPFGGPWILSTGTVSIALRENEALCFEFTRSEDHPSRQVL